MPCSQKYMWEFAMLALGCIPLMGFATSLEMQKMLGSDEGTDDDEDAVKNSPGGMYVLRCNGLFCINRPLSALWRLY